MSIQVECGKCHRRAPRGTSPCPKCGTPMREGKGLAYWVDAVDGQGKRWRRRLGRDAKLAEQIDAEITVARLKGLAWVDPDLSAGPSLAGLEKAYLGSQEFLALKDQRVRQNYLKATVLRLGSDLLAASLTPTLIHGYIESRKKAGKSNTTINHELAALNVALEWCAKHGPEGSAEPYLPRNPIAGFERETYNAPRTSVATYPQYVAIKNELPPVTDSDAWAMFECRIRLPFRGREMDKLLVTDVQLDRGEGKAGRIVIRPEISKSGKERVIPLWWPHLPELLRRVIDGRTSGPLFRYSKRGAHQEPEWKGYAAEPYGAISAAISRVGITGLQVRDLRATAITVLVKHGIPLHELADASDHMSLLMQHRYVRKAAELDWPLEGYYDPVSGIIKPLAASGSVASPSRFFGRRSQST